MSEDLQQRVEQTAPGRIAISAFIAVTVVALVVTNLPESQLRDKTLEAAEPYANAIGLNQTWSVFAPDPRRESIRLEAHVTAADGTRSTWRPPLRGALLGTYRDYRWRKWVENVIQDSHERLWSPAARFIARRGDLGGAPPRKVVLVRLWQPLRPPGASPRTEPWRRYVFYRLTLPLRGPR